VGEDNQDIINRAGEAWNRKQDVIRWGFAQSARYPHVIVRDGEYASPWSALVSWVCVNGHFCSEEVEITINDRAMNRAGYDERQRQFVLTHELGHAAGLDHLDLACGRSIMDRCSCTDSDFRDPPWWDDIRALQQLYPRG
jgi:hypothetical protein